MGRHSAPGRKGALRDIGRLEPASQSAETLRDAVHRQRGTRVKPAMQARRRQRFKRTLLWIAGIIVFVLVAGAVAGYAYYRKISNDVAQKSEKMNPGIANVLTKPKVKQPNAPFYMVMMGEDTRPGETQARSDTLMVAYVDPPKKHVAIISIPRDSRVEIPGHGKTKINAAAQIGGAKLTIETVRLLTGLPISHYVELDFNGFRDLVDAVGGVTVTVPTTISDVKAAGYLPNAVTVKKGVQKLDGYHALTFVRSRKFADGDFTRIKDQQIFIKALVKQTLQPGNILKIPAIVQAIEKNVVTDLTLQQIVSLAEDFKGMGSGAVEGVMAPGVPQYIGGISYVILDTDKIDVLVKRMRAGEPLVPVATPSGKTSGTVTPKPSNITVDVRNGAGQAGLGAEVSGILKKAGYHVTAVGNTGRPVYGHTLIVFKTNEGAPKAQMIDTTLGFGTVVQTNTLYTFSTHILVIVGKDWRKKFPNGFVAP
jgi:LCP family protein required for cell wall assembly